MEIIVYSSWELRSKHKSCYSRRIEMVKGVDIPFSLLLRSMKVLYGENCIVEFVCV